MKRNEFRYSGKDPLHDLAYGFINWRRQVSYQLPSVLVQERVHVVA